MKRKAVRNVTVGALASGLVPLVGAGLSPAPAGAGADQSPMALCEANFGQHGPYGGSIAGEGPAGDPMTVTVGWEPGEWPDGLREAITCIGIGGHSALSLTRSTMAPPNTGNLIVDLTLPPGPAGSLVCQQTILIGKGVRDGQQRQSDPVCFKLREAEQMMPDDGAAPGPRASSPKAPALRVPGDVRSLLPGGVAANPGQATTIHATPPARAAFEAARGAARSPQAWSAPTTRPAPALAPTAPVTHAGQAANELARTPSVSGRSMSAELPLARPRPGGTALGRSAAGTVKGQAAAGIKGAAAGSEAARSALPRTGVGDKIPLAGAGGLLAIGGAAIILGEPRRRGARRPA